MSFVVRVGLASRKGREGKKNGRKNELTTPPPYFDLLPPPQNVPFVFITHPYLILPLNKSKLVKLALSGIRNLIASSVISLESRLRV